MRNIVMKIAYDARPYHGWQIQKNAVTVQEVFQNALLKMLGERCDIKGCSRTDTGVHAKEYVLNFHTENHIPCRNLLMGMNTSLPKSIVVFDCFETTPDFHSRYSCKSKRYRYVVLNSKVRDPFWDGLSYYYPYKTDASLLDRCAKDYLGEHDFAAFCSIGGKTHDTVRTIYSFDAIQNGIFLEFITEGNGFLYNMVRIMVGTLLRINEGKLSPDAIPLIIASRDRKKAGVTAPPQGLYLEKVNY